MSSESTGANGGLALAAKIWGRLIKALSAADRKRLAWATVAIVLGSMTTAAVPVIVGTFVDAVFQDGTLAGLGDAIWPMTLLLLAYAFISAMEVAKHQLVHTVTTGFESDARQKIYGHLLRWDLKRFREGSDGAIYGRANRSVEGAAKLIKLGAADLAPALLVAIFAVVLAWIKYGWLGAVMSMVIPTGFGLVFWQIHSQNGIRVALNSAKERIDGSVGAWLAMLKVIRTSGTEGYFDRRVGDECDRLRRTELRHHIAMSLFDAGKAVNEAFWLVVCLVVTITMGASRSAGDLAGEVLLYLAITKPLRELHRVFDESSEAALQADNLLNDLDVPYDISFADRAAVTDRTATPLAAEDAIVFDNVTFSYDGAPKPTLDGLSTRIKAGERVGIVGSSGGGKSTMLDLLARLHHGHSGEVLLQGRPVEEIGRSELVTILGYVSQEPSLFPGTIRENLLLGRENVNDTDLDDACRRANILGEIHALPNGYDTTVAQRGSNVSGGQRQRLCIARALLATPPVMLLDEPTSALDGPSQAVVQQAIDELYGVTMLVVAHRLSTLRTMDRIIVLHEGRVVQDGRYDQLSEEEGYFAQMLESERWNAA